MARNTRAILLLLASITGLVMTGCGSGSDPLALPQQRYDQVVGKVQKAVFCKGTPIIDGIKDDIWGKSPVYKTTRQNQFPEDSSCWAEFQCLWDSSAYYCYVTVRDTSIETKNTAGDHMNDGVEFYIDERNDSTVSGYDSGSVQYRFNADGAKGIGPIAPVNPDTLKAGFSGVTKKVAGGYVIEIKIPFRFTTPKIGTVFGFDLQVNDMSSGSRIGAICFNQSDNTAWQTHLSFGKGVCFP